MLSKKQIETAFPRGDKERQDRESKEAADLQAVERERQKLIAEGEEEERLLVPPAESSERPPAEVARRLEALERRVPTGSDVVRVPEYELTRRNQRRQALRDHRARVAEKDRYGYELETGVRARRDEFWDEQTRIEVERDTAIGNITARAQAERAATREKAQADIDTARERCDADVRSKIEKAEAIAALRGATAAEAAEAARELDAIANDIEAPSGVRSQAVFLRNELMYTAAPSAQAKRENVMAAATSFGSANT